MVNIAIFASGTGTNFSALLEKVAQHQDEMQVVGLVCDRPEAPVVTRAHAAQIPVWTQEIKTFTSKTEYERAILQFLAPLKPDLIVLAGYMKIISTTLLSAYAGKIINLHPALLPNFPGRHGIEDAYRAGVKATGVTVHYVDAGIDSGPIIKQQTVPILAKDTLETLTKRIHQVEHQIYFTSLCQVIAEQHLNNKGK